MHYISEFEIKMRILRLIAARVNHGTTGFAYSWRDEVCVRRREVSYAEKGTEATVARDPV